MKDLNISVNPTNNCFTIMLNQMDLKSVWTSLIVDGQHVKPWNRNGTQYLYTQKSPKDQFYFKAITNKEIDLYSVRNTMILKGPVLTDYICTIMYDNDGGSGCVLRGVITTIKDERDPIAKQGPIEFCKGKMTGIFTTN